MVLSVLRRIHRWLGLLLAVPLLIQGVSGAILALTPVLPDLAAIDGDQGRAAQRRRHHRRGAGGCPGRYARRALHSGRVARRDGAGVVRRPRPAHAAAASVVRIDPVSLADARPAGRRWPDRLDQGAAHQSADRGPIRPFDHRLGRRRAARPRDDRRCAVVAAAWTVACGVHRRSAGDGSRVPPPAAWRGRHLEPRAAAGDGRDRRGAGVSADGARCARSDRCRSAAAPSAGWRAGGGCRSRDRPGRWARRTASALRAVLLPAGAADPVRVLLVPPGAEGVAAMVAVAVDADGTRVAVGAGPARHAARRTGAALGARSAFRPGARPAVAWP